jgi:histidyl-tRNA synthetase
MIRSGITTHVISDNFTNKAISIASHYGFAPIEELLTQEDRKELEQRMESSRNLRVPSLSPSSSISDLARMVRRDPLSEKVISLMKVCAERKIGLTREPVLFYYNSQTAGDILRGSGHYDHSKKEGGSVQFMLTVMGTKHSIAEAIVLKTVLAILDDIGLRENCVHINSMGDRESARKFTRELISYFRKNANLLSEHERQTLKSDLFRVLDHSYKKKHSFHAEIPKTMEFLSDKSRVHLREVLEYLEKDDIPYEIDDQVIGNSRVYSETLFEIHGLDDEMRDENNTERRVLARGGRCDEIGRQLFRTKMPAVAIMVEYLPKSKRADKLTASKKKRSPRVSLIQVGYAARLLTLPIIEILRKANIPLYHNLSNDKLSGQLEAIEKLSIPYTIIIGQREAIDGTVIIRNMDTMAQDTVAINTLPEYMKKIKM